MEANPHWIHVELEPVWAHVKNLRHFVREFCIGMAVSPETSDQVAMTTSELLENATKYASTAWVRFDLRLAGGFAEVSVTNRATDEQWQVLAGFMVEVNRGEALEAYVSCLERQSGTGLSQSGLARIRYEAAAELAVRHDGQEVCVIAKIPL
jgi:hypothetical protein